MLIARLRAAGCVYAEDEARLLLDAAADPDELERMVAARVAGTPLEQVLGWAEFAGLRIAVEPGVFVPRRRSEVLVSAALDRLAPGAVVIDLCCGSGAVGAAIASRQRTELHAADLDPVAVRCAARNLAKYGAPTYCGDLFDPLPAELRGRVTVIVANAPYVPSDRIALMPTEARDHEPRLALDGGADGVALHRRIAAAAPEWLAPGGRALIETSPDQAGLTRAAVVAAGLTATVVHDASVEGTAVIGAASAEAPSQPE